MKTTKRQREQIYKWNKEHKEEKNAWHRKTYKKTFSKNMSKEEAELLKRIINE